MPVPRPVIWLWLLTAASCSRPVPPPPLSAKPIGPALTLRIPLGLPPLPIPPDNPPTAAAVALGEKLFFSTELSADRSISCSTCHDPRKGFADGQPVSTGVAGKRGNRNAPSARNSLYARHQFWDGRAANLEEQAAGPITNPIEMAQTAQGVEQRLSQDPAWRTLFQTAFGPASPGRSPVTFERLTRAIASYERTLVRANSPFDRYLFAGDRSALSPAAVRGLAVFRDPAKGNCAACHLIGAKSAVLTDNLFHNLGAGLSPEGELTDLGRYTVTRRDGDQGAFRTSSLREVATTAPYMHDGSLKTLKEVVDFYIGGGNANPYRDKQIRPLTHLTRQERADLVAFLESLTGEDSQSQ